MDNGRYFIHEHPKCALSWGTDAISGILSDERVHRVRADQCQYGAVVVNGHLQGKPILKPTGFMSNSLKVLEKLGRRCRGRGGTCSRPTGGSHAICSGRIARDAAVYPRGLCRALLQGMTSQVRFDGKLQEGCFGIQAEIDEVRVEYPERKAKASGRFKDDITGQPLMDHLVLEARRQELAYFMSKGVWVKRPRGEAARRTGRPPISVRWVDVNKGDDENPKYRSRLVARQLKIMDKSGESFFSPTPPLEALPPYSPALRPLQKITGQYESQNILTVLRYLRWIYPGPILTLKRTRMTSPTSSYLRRMAIMVTCAAYSFIICTVRAEPRTDGRKSIVPL